MLPSNRDVDLDELQPHPQNYNRHPAEQVRRLAKSLTKFGQVRSVVVWRNTLLAGHGVVEAARILNWRTVRADVLPDDYPEHLALAYIAADNELARQGDPDMAQLAAILEESKAADAELLEAIGYSDKEFEALLKEVGKGAAGVEDVGAQVDKADELRQKWGTAAGQLWQLGEHRLICGDCTDPATVARVMGGERAALVFTDPPYNVDVAGGSHDPRDTKNYRSGNTLSNDKMTPKEFYAFLLTAFQSTIAVMADGASFYVCFSDSEIRNFVDAFQDAGVYYSQMVIWKKQQLVFGRKDYHSKHEPILYGWKLGAAHYFVDDRTQDTVWEIDRPMRSEKEHPTQKPVELYERAIANSSVSGAVVYEPFVGTGTALLACENLKRHCRAVELDPRFMAVALERWAMSTGKTPVLVGGDDAK